MKQRTRYLALILAVCLVPASGAFADKDKDDKDKKERQGESSAVLRTRGSGPDPGQCTQGVAQKDLDINNVRARLFNIGSIGYGNGAEAQYIAPQASGHSPFYAISIWIGGMVGSELRTAGATFNNFEFWPGPLGPDGRPVNPNDCSAYDRIYKVSRSDIQNYEATGQAAEDLAEWPYDLGAPVIDGDGTEGNYNLAGGDRPDLIGDQAVWWIMNDVGNAHRNTQAAPIGVEVRVHAFAFHRADALGETTFYKYNVTYKGDEPLTDTYFSIFSDPDLGAAWDDFVGTDTTLGLGYVYNDNVVDEVYGPAPAAGFDFFQGPIAEDGDTLAATSVMYFVNGGPRGMELPRLAQEIYNIQRGLWREGQPLTATGIGIRTDGPITKFAYPGDPVTGAFWSEVNNDGNGSRNQSGNRHFTVSTGPFTMRPGDSQDIVFGIVFAQSTDNLSSITALRDADALAQAAFDAGFDITLSLPPPPLCNPNASDAELHPGSGNCLYASELDGQAHLVWGYPSTSENYLGSFDAADPFLAKLDFNDKTYTFEGFNVYRYPTSSFAPEQREHVATFDVVNGVTKVIDLEPVFDSEVGDLSQRVLSARGTDSGIQYNFPLSNLTNYTDYYYGVSAYAYSPNSTPKVLESPPTDITVRPSRIASTEGGSSLNSDVTSDSLAAAVTQRGQGIVTWRIVDPAQVTGSNYLVEFISLDDVEGPGGASGAGKLAYKVVRESDGKVIIDGADYFARTGEETPQAKNVLAFDGLAVSMDAPAPAFDAFSVVANAAGPLSPPAWAAASWQGFPGPAGVPASGAVGVPGQQSTIDSIFGWLIHTWPNGSRASYAAFLARTFQYTGGFGASFNGIGHIIPDDVEIRFTGNGKAWIKPGWAEVHGGAVVDVPFEWWNVGTSPDASDDVRLAPFLFDLNDDGRWNILYDALDPAASPGWADHEISSAGNDPWTEPVYVMHPTNDTPGQQGYEDAMAKYEELGAGGIDAGCSDWYYAPGAADIPECDVWNYLSRMVFVFWDGGDVSTAAGPEDYVMSEPEIGTVFRIATTKPHLPGDVFRIATAGMGRTAGDAGILEASIDDIGIVPNPYRGRSAYETGNEDRRTRFTNMPQTATISIYTVRGTLIRTLYKDGPSTSLDWNLTTDSNSAVGSGMYFIHIDVPGVGEKVMKFGVINRETNINVF